MDTPVYVKITIRDSSKLSVLILPLIYFNFFSGMK